MKFLIKGKVWKFGDNINTDIIAPAQYLHLSLNELKMHVMEPLDPEFPMKVKSGDIIVAGKNFGCGSSREHAPAALKELGISLIIAESFARIFFRNAISIGLPVLQCKGITEKCKSGDILEVNLVTGEIFNVTRNISLKAETLSKELLEILMAGGILEYLKVKIHKPK